jgi:ATP-dependent Clp protease ATP-binding subunit ClpC
VGDFNVTSPLDISEQEIRERCASILSAAVDEAGRLHHNFIGTEHLYNALSKIEGGTTQRLLLAAGLDPRTTRNAIRRESGAGDTEPEDEPPFSPRAYRVLAMAVYHADDYGDDRVQEAHLLLALLQEGEGIPVRKLIALGVNIDSWIEQLFEELKQGNGERGLGDDLDPDSDQASHAPTPLLDKYGRDLTELARNGKITPAIGREREIRAVARTLTRSKKNNPLLLGDSGVGKTAVVEGLAYNIVQGTAPSPLLGKRLIQIEIGTLVAGTSLRGQFEERLVGIIDEARNAPGTILFIDEIHTIVGAGDTIDSNLDAANILKPALSRGEIICVGATTNEEYRKAIAQDAALDRRFRTIQIDEPTPEDTLTILTNVQERYTKHHNVHIRPEALKAAVSLSSKYMIDRRQPDKALDLLDEACARIVIQTPEPEDGSPRVVTAEAVAEVLAEWTGIPLAELNEDERRKYQRMESSLANRVVGQDHAIRVVTDAIKTNRAGLSDPSRPVGVFLFLGPSGVGKTELAKALAAFLFGSEDALIRLDMSEFHDEHTVARLIGSPPGYKDSQRGGQLTEALRRKPYSVVLLDEVEKAAPEVFDIFLQVFDDGRLTDSRGATVDARHAVWIMTSNIGTAEGGKALGFRNEGNEGFRAPSYATVLKRFFRPEFLNRLDEVIVFNTLSQKVLTDILELHLGELRDRLSKQQLKLRLEQDAQALILSQGYDPANGARPLRRAIERLLTRPLSQVILDGLYPPGATVVAKANGEQLAFDCQTEPVVILAEASV